MKPTYITGNAHKAERFQKLIGRELPYQALDLPEIQSLDLRDIVEDKARRAYNAIGAPVIVEDTSLTFNALGKLPGPLIKWFLKSLSFQEICNLIPETDREALVEVMFGYYDGNAPGTFVTKTKGTIPLTPKGETGFGWDPIFIPEGYAITRAEMTPEKNERHYAEVKPFHELRRFFNELLD